MMKETSFLPVVGWLCLVVFTQRVTTASSFLYVRFRLHSEHSLKAGKIVRISDEEVKSGDKTSCCWLAEERKEEANWL